MSMVECRVGLDRVLEKETVGSWGGRALVTVD